MKMWLLAAATVALATVALVTLANRELARIGPQLQTALREQSGWSVRFRGPSLGLWPAPCVRIGDLDARDEARDEPRSVTAARVDVRLGLTALVTGAFPVRTVTAADPVFIASRTGNEGPPVEVRMTELAVLVRAPTRGVGAPDAFDVEASGLRLSGLPPAEVLLSAAAGVGGIAAALPESFRERHPALFGRAPVAFDRLHCPVRLDGATALLRACTLSAPDYELRTDGSVSPQRGADLESRLVATEAVTREILQKVPLARPLLNRENRLQLRFFVRGPIERLRIEPDEAPLARALAEALGSGDRPSRGHRSLEDAVRRGLDKLLRR